ncbi:MAG TPA: hypothetical protein VFN11_15710 [Ktedonobacterales bacterium]|nr:hypothetical protein [Ktedonobacterales bacterium]
MAERLLWLSRPMSAASLADNQMVAQIVATFQLPAKIDPVTTP